MTDKPNGWMPVTLDPTLAERVRRPADIEKTQALKDRMLWDTFRKALLMLVDGIERYLGYTDEQRTAEIRRRAK